LIDLIGKISDEETKKESLSKLKDFILKEENKFIKFDIETPTLTKLSQTYLTPNPFQQLTTKEIQIKVNELKAQVWDLRHEITKLKATNLELHTKLSILETQIPSFSHISDNFQSIENITENEVSQE